MKLSLEQRLDKLDGAVVGRLGITKTMVFNEPWLTVYDRDGNGKGFGDEQLTLRPEELLALSRVVTACANSPLCNTAPTGGGRGER